MTDPSLKFAEGFSMPTYEQWVAEVEKALKGAPFDKRMYTKTYEGITLRPIYTPGLAGGGRSVGLSGGDALYARRTRGGQSCRQLGRAAELRVSRSCASERHHPGRARSRRHLSAHPLRRRSLAASTPTSRADKLAGTDGMMIYSVDALDRLSTVSTST